MQMLESDAVTEMTLVAIDRKYNILEALSYNNH